MVDFLGSKVTLVCLRQSTRVSFMGWLDTPTLFSRLNAWIVVFDVEHDEEYLEAVDLASYVGTTSRALSLRNLVSGYECGRVFPAGVGPGSSSRDAANWLPSRSDLSVETRRQYG